jgi:predicted DNA binding CopG/RHH family protein
MEAKSSLQFLYDNFKEALKKYKEDKEFIEKQIQELNEKKEKLFFPRLEVELKPIAEEIKIRLQADSFNISKQGPLSYKVSIWFIKGEETNVGYLCFGQYRDGSIFMSPNIFDMEGAIELKDLTIENLTDLAKKNI